MLACLHQFWAKSSLTSLFLKYPYRSATCNNLFNRCEKQETNLRSSVMIISRFLARDMSSSRFWWEESPNMTRHLHSVPMISLTLANFQFIFVQSSLYNWRFNREITIVSPSYPFVWSSRNGSSWSIFNSSTVIHMGCCPDGSKWWRVSKWKSNFKGSALSETSVWSNY